MAENRTFSDEVLLGLIKSNSGGGGGGTSNYNQLENKPQIGGVTLTGNKSASDLGLASAIALANKVDKVDGKGLSSNDYTDADKAIVGGVTAALSGKQNALTAGRNINLSNDEVKAGVFVEAGVDVDIDEYSIQSGTETYTIAESGLYEIFYCLTLQSAVSVTLPESANVLIERDLSISNHPVKHIVAELEAGSTVTITQTPNQWRTVMSGILKLDAISVNNVVHVDSIADSTVSFKLPNDDKYYLVIGTAVGNSVASNSTRDDTSGGNPTIVKTQSAEYARFRSVIVKGSDSPNFSFYGYDGGVAAIIAFEVSLEEGNWDYNLVTKDYVDSALASKVNTSAVGVAGGVAGLGNDGKVPASQLPAQQELTAGQYIDITNDAISVQRDIARDVDAIITTSFDFPNCTVTKTIDEEVVDTVTFSIYGDIPSSVMDVYSINYNISAMVLIFTNLVASKEQAVGYTFNVASYASGVIDTQTFVETVDADKKLIIKSELDTAIADKADKADVKNEFIGTQAEWNTLTTAEKKAFDTYQITDDYSEALMPNYSTTEQKTGQKWIDGKDIYFRTFTGLSIQSNTSWITTDIDISDTDTIVDGVAQDNWKQVITNSFGKSNEGFLILRSMFAGNTIETVTLYYTKTV